MLQWILSKLGRGPKAIELPEAKTEDVRTLYFGRFSTDSEPTWRFSRQTHVLAMIKRYGTTVLELTIKKDLSGTPLADEILSNLEKRFTVPQVTWVDQV